MIARAVLYSSPIQPNHLLPWFIFGLCFRFAPSSYDAPREVVRPLDATIEVLMFDIQSTPATDRECFPEQESARTHRERRGKGSR